MPDIKIVKVNEIELYFFIGKKIFKPAMLTIISIRNIPRNIILK